MNKKTEEEVIAYVKSYVTENLPLSNMSDEELLDNVEELVGNYFENTYISLKERAGIVKQIFSSIRGLGLLDSIISDDDITEVMINGPDNIFIEKKGRLIKLKEKFESERRLEDIIQRIVGSAGREVNQANPIVDTRLSDGSRVNDIVNIGLHFFLKNIRPYANSCSEA